MILLKTSAIMGSLDNNGIQSEAGSSQRRNAGEEDFADWIAHDNPVNHSDDKSSVVSPGQAETYAPGTAMILSVDQPDLTGVLYGWHLEAQQGLSQLYASEHQAEASRRGLGPDGDTIQNHYDTSFSQFAIQDIATGHGNACSGGQTIGSTGTISTVNAAKAAVAASDIDKASRAAMVAPLIWSERYLRSFPDAAGGVTLWLRDYRLAPEQMELAIRTLIDNHTGSDQVTRIVINGVELWRQDSSHSTETT